MAQNSTSLKVSAYSTARYGTWYFLEQYNLLFDAGDGTVANLRGKCGKVRHVFLSHADRDHLGSLIQFYQTVAASPNPPKFYYPKDSGSFPALRDFLHKFDPHLPPCEWVPIEGGMRIEVSDHLLVEIGENDHIASSQEAARGLVKSLDFSLIETRRKLKVEFQGLPGQEISKLRTEKGEDFITNVIERSLFGYSGDAPCFDQVRWERSEVLAHEGTFISPDEGDRGHCEMNSVLQKASELNLKALIIGHISVRYKNEQILKTLKEETEKLQPSFPVYVILPGQVVWDVLGQTPVWSV